MRERTIRAFGGGAALGAALAVLASVPTRWYGAPQTDAYLFDPAVLSPLWVERTLVPAATVLAVVLLVAGVAALTARDWAVAGRARRWGGSTATLGLAFVGFTALTLAVGRGSGALTGSLLVIVGVLVGLVGALLALVGLVVAGVGHARAGRSTVGYALAGGTGLATLVAVVGVVGDLPDVLGFLPFAVPFAAGFAAVGHELWTHPGPVAGPGGGGGDGEQSSPADDADDREGSTEST